ncbi:MAG TPA: AIR synthase-related protein, partial [Thermomicrobiaceae bacterium]|nr:AIR synthase-related protein [Thermomicrobiaceae bacterium]
EAAVASMMALNRLAARAMIDSAASAATDITGFGIVGHAIEMAEKSGVRIVVDANDLPFLPGARQYAFDEYLPGGAHRNREFYSQHPRAPLRIDPRIAPEVTSLLYDPETSGGLLISIQAGSADSFERRCVELGQPVWRCGRVEAGLGVEFT